MDKIIQNLVDNDKAILLGLEQILSILASADPKWQTQYDLIKARMQTLYDLANKARMQALYDLANKDMSNLANEEKVVVDKTKSEFENPEFVKNEELVKKCFEHALKLVEDKLLTPIEYINMDLLNNKIIELRNEIFRLSTSDVSEFFNLDQKKNESNLQESAVQSPVDGSARPDSEVSASV